jgi:anti-sigma B factor antagonist
MDTLKALIGTEHTNGSQFAVVESWTQQVAVLSLTGELDMLTAPQLEAAIVAAATKEPAAVIVDLTKVTFLASAGMTVLVSGFLDLTPSVQFGIVAGGVAVSRPLKLTGIDTLVTLFPTLDDAVSNFAAESTGAAT